MVGSWMWEKRSGVDIGSSFRWKWLKSSIFKKQIAQEWLVQGDASYKKSQAFDTWSSVDGCLGKVRKCYLVGEGVSLRADFRFQKICAIPSVLLPPVAAPAVSASIPLLHHHSLKPQAQLNDFFYNFPWSWSFIIAIEVTSILGLDV